MTEDEISARVAHALRFPWTVHVTAEDGELVARVAELPDAIATGANTTELERDLWESIRASLRARMEFGDPIPTPQRMLNQPNVHPAKILPFTPVSAPAVQTSASSPLAILAN